MQSPRSLRILSPFSCVMFMASTLCCSPLQEKLVFTQKDLETTPVEAMLLIRISR